jgi:hypothetical protein
MTIEYRSSMLNVVVSALRKNAQLFFLKEEEEEFRTGGIHIHILEELHERIKIRLEHDHMTMNIMM